MSWQSNCITVSFSLKKQYTAGNLHLCGISLTLRPGSAAAYPAILVKYLEGFCWTTARFLWHQWRSESALTYDCAIDTLSRVICSPKGWTLLSLVSRNTSTPQCIQGPQLVLHCNLLEVAVDLPQGSICNFLIIVLGIVDYRFSEL